MYLQNKFKKNVHLISMWTGFKGLEYNMCFINSFNEHFQRPQKISQCLDKVHYGTEFIWIQLYLSMGEKKRKNIYLWFF